jgi:hypothetical protein
VRPLTDAELKQVRRLKTAAESLQVVIDAIGQGEMSLKDQRLIDFFVRRLLEEMKALLESTIDVKAAPP